MEAAAIVNVPLTLTSNEVGFVINVLGETKSSTGAFPLMQKLLFSLRQAEAAAVQREAEAAAQPAAEGQEAPPQADNE